MLLLFCFRIPTTPRWREVLTDLCHIWLWSGPLTLPPRYHTHIQEMAPSGSALRGLLQVPLLGQKHVTHQPTSISLLRKSRRASRHLVGGTTFGKIIVGGQCFGGTIWWMWSGLFVFSLWKVFNSLSWIFSYTFFVCLFYSKCFVKVAKYSSQLIC